jgi:hypothetical protein
MDNLGTDILLERRHEFSVDGRMYHIAPPSLGKLFVLQGLIEDIGINEKLLASMPNVELLRVAEAEKHKCCELIAYATCDTREQLCNVGELEKRTKHFEFHLDSAEIATLLVATFSHNRHHQFMEEAGIIKERERMAAIARHKEKGGGVAFGGKTLFGQLIDPACERYGWTYEYAVWGISYAALTAMMADKVTSIILTDDEKKKVPKHLLETEDAISGDDPKNWAKLQQMMNME